MAQLGLSSESTDPFQRVRAALDDGRVPLGPAEALLPPERFDTASQQLYRASAGRLDREKLGPYGHAPLEER